MPDILTVLVLGVASVATVSVVALGVVARVRTVNKRLKLIKVVPHWFMFKQFQTFGAFFGRTMANTTHTVDKRVPVAHWRSDDSWSNHSLTLSLSPIVTIPGQTFIGPIRTFPGILFL